MWPVHFDTRLYPFALEYDAYLWNHLSNARGGLSPVELYTSAKIDMDFLKKERIWRCSAYVLDPKLQDGKKLPKCDPKTRQGKYVGKSPRHAGSVGLIRNPQTGYISP